jgi:hypothetical protein
MRYRVLRQSQIYPISPSLLSPTSEKTDVQSARPIELIAISAAVIRLSSKPVYQTVALDRRRRIGRTETCGPALQDEEVHSLAALWTRRGLNVFCR